MLAQLVIVERGVMSLIWPLFWEYDSFRECCRAEAGPCNNAAKCFKQLSNNVLHSKPPTGYLMQVLRPQQKVKQSQNSELAARLFFVNITADTCIQRVPRFCPTSSSIRGILFPLCGTFYTLHTTIFFQIPDVILDTTTALFWSGLRLRLGCTHGLSVGYKCQG